MFEHCARTDYIRSLLGDKYEVMDVTLSPADWGQTCMKRPRLFTLVFRKETVQVLREPAAVLQQLCDAVKKNIQVSPSIGDYLEWTPTELLQDQQSLREAETRPGGLILASRVSRRRLRPVF